MSLTLSTQGSVELDDHLRATVLDNAGTLVCFRLGPDDANHLAPQLGREHQDFNPSQLTQLAVGEAWVKMQSAHGGDALHLRTYSAPEPIGNPDAVRKQSRQHYTRPVQQVADYIRMVTAHTTSKPKRKTRRQHRMPTVPQVADYIARVNAEPATPEPPTKRERER